MNHFNRRFEKNPFVASRVIDGVVLLVPVKQPGQEIRRLYRLEDPVASRIWELTDGRRSVRKIHQSLCQEFKTDDQRIERDLFKFIRRLESMGVVRIAQTPVRRSPKQ